MSLLNRMSSIINAFNLSNEIKDFMHTDADMKDDLIDSETPSPLLQQTNANTCASYLLFLYNNNNNNNRFQDIVCT